MQSRLIFHNPGNRRLIIIFAGWSTTPSFYRDLHAEGWDIAVVWDYSSLDFDASVTDGYESVFIIGWSMGVAAAAHAAATTLPPERISAAFAVNGTLYPSSDSYGIPEAIYEGTRATLNARNLLKFTRRMGYVAPDPATLPPLSPEDIYIPDFESLANELDNVRANTKKGRLPWKRAYISTGDRIFPPQSMKAYWTVDPSHPEIIEIDSPHYVRLQSIIDEVTPDLPRIGRRFKKAVPTYDANASAQQLIVDKLADMLPVEACSDIRSMLEIGAGSGMLSRRLAEILPELEEATFLDLYPLPRFDIAARESYVEADAEKWMMEAESESFDLIASANTMQWFADPDSFFRHSARVLRSGGYFLCSTFLKGNLKELDTKRPSPLLYRTAEELLAMLSRHFDEVLTSATPITLTFPTRRDLLLHLKLTGVGGGAPSSLPYRSETSSQFTPENPLTLTYTPFYVLARKK